jgi:hypothetical protein
MNRLICLILTALVTGCAGMQDAMTPSASVIRDDFDGKIIVRQSPVSAASSLAEPFHTLGFEWSQKFPDLVFITVGQAFQARPITSVAFNADGIVLDRIKPASVLTEYQDKASSRRFEMALLDFTSIAAAKVVKMRVESLNDYTVSSFGLGTGDGAAVNSKFRPFLEQVAAIRSGRKL